MIVTLTTDFGPGHYVASMKGVLLEINPDLTIVDIDHTVSPQDVRQGAYAMYAATPWYPFAIHVGVVDPGVGTERRPIAIACEGAILVGPDNGLLIPAANAFGIKEVRHITSGEYRLPRASYVFHGRDIFAPVAAHLSKGIKLHDLGPEITDYVRLDFGEPEVTEAEIRGEVLAVDRFGNLITNIDRGTVSQRWRFRQRVEVAVGDETIRTRILRTYGEAEGGEVLATMSSSNFLEIAKRDGNASEALGARPGTRVSIRAIPT